jgi:hypothetical protein
VLANTSNNNKTIEILPKNYKAILLNDKVQMNVSTDEEIAQIVDLLVQNNISVYEIHRNNADLESIFMNYIN